MGTQRPLGNICSWDFIWNTSEEWMYFKIGLKHKIDYINKMLFTKMLLIENEKWHYKHDFNEANIK